MRERDERGGEGEGGVVVERGGERDLPAVAKS